MIFFIFKESNGETKEMGKLRVRRI